MHINVDLDGVLADTMQLTCALAWRELEVFVHPEMITDFFYKSGAIDISYFVDTLTLKDENLILVPEVAGAVDSLRHLSGYSMLKLDITTARQKKFERVTMNWLSLHGMMYDNLKMLNGHDKADLGGDVLIDDYDVNLKAYLRNNKNSYGILFPRPWNLTSRVPLSKEFSTRMIFPLGDNDAERWNSIVYSLKQIMDIVDHTPAWIQASF